MNVSSRTFRRGIATAIALITITVCAAARADLMSLLPGKLDFSHVTDLTCKGKIYWATDSSVIDPPCRWVDCAMLTQQVWTVATGSATKLRPMYDIAKYQACIAAGSTDAVCAGSSTTWKKVGDVDELTACEAVSIRKTSSSDYHKTTNKAGVSGAAICKSAVVSMLPTTTWAPTGQVLGAIKITSPTTPEDVARCTQAYPASAPPATGQNVFCITSDDGGEILIDGVAVASSMKEQPATKTCSAPMTLASGSHPIVVRYFEAGGEASLVVADGNGVTIKAGWKCSYFNNRTFSGAATLMRAESELNFNWRSGSPDPSIVGDNWSALCSGTLITP